MLIYYVQTGIVNFSSSLFTLHFILICLQSQHCSTFLDFFKWKTPELEHRIYCFYIYLYFVKFIWHQGFKPVAKKHFLDTFWGVATLHLAPPLSRIIFTCTQAPWGPCNSVWKLMNCIRKIINSTRSMNFSMNFNVLQCNAMCRGVLQCTVFNKMCDFKSIIEAYTIKVLNCTSVTITQCTVNIQCNVQYRTYTGWCCTQAFDTVHLRCIILQCRYSTVHVPRIPTRHVQYSTRICSTVHRT